MSRGSSRSGADKVGVNSAAIARPRSDRRDRRPLRRAGARALARRHARRRIRAASSSPRTAGAPKPTLDAVEWAREAIERGAGELLVNSIDADGTKQGFDLELIARRCARSSAFR